MKIRLRKEPDGRVSVFHTLHQVLVLDVEYSDDSGTLRTRQAVVPTRTWTTVVG